MQIPGACWFHKSEAGASDTALLHRAQHGGGRAVLGGREAALPAEQPTQATHIYEVPEQTAQISLSTGR